MIPAVALANWSAPASLNGAEMVPPNTSTAKAFGTVHILEGVNGIQDTIVVNITYHGLTGSGISAAHIHGPAAPGENEVPMIFFTAGTHFTANTTSGTLSATLPLSAGNRGHVLAGNTYINLHSLPSFADGEIRGQIDSLVPFVPGVRGKVPGTTDPLLALLTVALAGAGVLYMMRRRSSA
jgi:hypothetical protein